MACTHALCAHAYAHMHVHKRGVLLHVLPFWALACCCRASEPSTSDITAPIGLVARDYTETAVTTAVAISCGTPALAPTLLTGSALVLVGLGAYSLGVAGSIAVFGVSSATTGVFLRIRNSRKSAGSTSSSSDGFFAACASDGSVNLGLEGSADCAAADWRKRLQLKLQAAHHKVIIFVHGFNVRQAEALAAARALQEGLNTAAAQQPEGTSSTYTVVALRGTAGLHCST
jgi:hypothetical protein